MSVGIWYMNHLRDLLCNQQYILPLKFLYINPLSPCSFFISRMFLYTAYFSPGYLKSSVFILSGAK